MSANATLSIDGAAEIPCTLEIATQTIDASTFSGETKPDLAWTLVDKAGHFHAFDHEGKHVSARAPGRVTSGHLA